jgi:hypothetical protein
MMGLRRGERGVCCENWKTAKDISKVGKSSRGKGSAVTERKQVVGL